MKPHPPIKFSYQVTDAFYAGEYPFKSSPEDGIPKLNCLIDFGITTMIDLTSEPSLTQYAEYLPETCTRHHFPTNDLTCPEFSTLKEIHAIIDEAGRHGKKVYVHCKGGYDRTGVVVATQFVYAGLSPSLAKQKFYEVFVPPMKDRYHYPPLIEKHWEILEQYQDWLQKTTR